MQFARPRMEMVRFQTTAAICTPAVCSNSYKVVVLARAPRRPCRSADLPAVLGPTTVVLGASPTVMGCGPKQRKPDGDAFETHVDTSGSGGDLQRVGAFVQDGEIAAISGV